MQLRVLGCEFLCRGEKEDNFLCACTDPAALARSRRSLERRGSNERRRRRERRRRKTATMINRLPTVPTPNWLPPLATRTWKRLGKRNKIRGVDTLTYDYVFDVSHPLSLMEENTAAVFAEIIGELCTMTRKCTVDWILEFGRFFPRFLRFWCWW